MSTPDKIAPKKLYLRSFKNDSFDVVQPNQTFITSYCCEYTRSDIVKKEVDELNKRDNFRRLEIALLEEKIQQLEFERSAPPVKVSNDELEEIKEVIMDSHGLHSNKDNLIIMALKQLRSRYEGGQTNKGGKG